MSEHDASWVYAECVPFAVKSGLTAFWYQNWVASLGSLAGAMGLFCEANRLQNGKKESGIGHAVAAAGLFATAGMYGYEGEWVMTSIEAGLGSLLAVQSAIACRSAPHAVSKVEEPPETLIDSLLKEGHEHVRQQQWEDAWTAYASAAHEAERCKEWRADVEAHFFLGYAWETAVKDGDDAHHAAQHAQQHLETLLGHLFGSNEEMLKLSRDEQNQRFGSLQTLSAEVISEGIKAYLQWRNLNPQWKRAYYVNPFAKKG